ncbi:putative fatty acyl-CoA reductase CG5065 [Dermacentor andersoni]|uniref:putative fatty acyl-CoA reductase CG5065 n=1 Tax=Dermacentor andersoni TaxID=34620 RepID=UPI003B3AF06B
MPPEAYLEQQSATPVGVHDENDGSQVAQFYKDRVVLITGGTGFIGKVLLEKLLRSCSGLKRVYLLVRSKRGKEPQARLKKMFDSQVCAYIPIYMTGRKLSSEDSSPEAEYSSVSSLSLDMFEHLKKEQPGALEKVTAMAGDLAQPDLGLSTSDRATLVDNVSVVFHSGATIKFDEPLRQVLVHVSTAYCNCDKPDVHEVIKPPCENAQQFFEALQSAGAEATGNTKECLFGHPNTYTLTKSLTESMLLEERGNIPVVIVRPSIVTASLTEPLPLGLGLLPLFIAEKKHLVDLVPVDIVANTLICVAWHTFMTRPTYMKVYHCTSGTLQQHTWADVVEAIQRAGSRYPLPDARFFPTMFATNSQLRYNIHLYCLRYLPASAADLALKLMRRKPRFVQLYKNVRKRMDVVQYFTTHGWLFRTNNVVGLARELSPKDKQLFNIDMRSLDWQSYWDHYFLGIRKYLFNAQDSELPNARSRLRWLYAMRLSLQALLLASACRLLTTPTAWNLGTTAMLLGRKTCETLLVPLGLPPKL